MEHPEEAASLAPPEAARGTAPAPGAHAALGRRPVSWRLAARLVLTALLLALGLFIVAPYLRALAWAAIFAIALWPLYERVEARTAPSLRREALPLAFTVLIGVVFLLPFAALAVEAVREFNQMADFVRRLDQTGVAVPSFVAGLPFSAPIESWWSDHLAHPGWAKDVVAQVNTSNNRALGRSVGMSVLHRVFLFAISLLTLFFLFRGGRDVADQSLVASRAVFGRRGERVLRQMGASVRGTVNGLVLVGLGEGVILGVFYMFAKIPHPLLLATFAAAAALIPFASYLAVGLAVAVALATVNFAWAAATLAIGVVVVFIADHFVRPTLIGGTTRLPFLWVLLGILGGVESFQLLGLFVGPAVMAALALLWRELVSGEV